MKNAFIYIAALVFLAGGFFSVNAETLLFTKDLDFGLRGSVEVVNLQTFLKNQGLYSGPITGNFLKLTFEAVKKFQIAQGITPVTGYFGPKTRAKANALLTGNPNTTIQGQIQSLSQQLQMLQKLFYERQRTASSTAPTINIVYGGGSGGGNITNPTPVPVVVQTIQSVPATTIASSTPSSTAYITNNSGGRRRGGITSPAPTSTPSVTPTSTPPIALPTSTTPIGSKLVWGAFAGSGLNDATTFESLVGRPMTLRAIFVGWGNNSPFPSEYGPSTRDKGKTLVIFWELTDGSGSLTQPSYNYDSITNGSWDSYMKTFAAAAKSYGGPIILAPFHEMNGNWDPWDGTVNGNSPAKFIAAWKYVKNIFSGVTNVKFAWDVNNLSVPNTAANAIEMYYPGSAYVDYVAIDGFNFGNPWQTFSQMFNAPLAKLKTYNKPIYILSMASAAGTQKAAWITDTFKVQIPLHPEIAGWVWFNENKEQNWTINSDAASLAAFKLILPN